MQPLCWASFIALCLLWERLPLLTERPQHHFWLLFPAPNAPDYVWKNGSWHAPSLTEGPPLCRPPGHAAQGCLCLPGLDQLDLCHCDSHLCGCAHLPHAVQCVSPSPEQVRSCLAHDSVHEVPQPCPMVEASSFWGQEALSWQACSNGMPCNSCATSTERSSATVHCVCCSLEVLYAQQACPVGCISCQSSVCVLCVQVLWPVFLAVLLPGHPPAYKGYNFFNARGLWFISTTQQNLWHTFFGSMVSSVCC